jgi:hypothetical protein
MLHTYPQTVLAVSTIDARPTVGKQITSLAYTILEACAGPHHDKKCGCTTQPPNCNTSEKRREVDAVAGKNLLYRIATGASQRQSQSTP